MKTEFSADKRTTEIRSRNRNLVSNCVCAHFDSAFTYNNHNKSNTKKANASSMNMLNKYFSFVVVLFIFSLYNFFIWVILITPYVYACVCVCVSSALALFYCVVAHCCLLYSMPVLSCPLKTDAYVYVLHLFVCMDKY